MDIKSPLSLAVVLLVFSAFANADSAEQKLDALEQEIFGEVTTADASGAIEAGSAKSGQGNEQASRGMGSPSSSADGASWSQLWE